MLHAMKLFSDPSGNLLDHASVGDGSFPESRNNWAKQITYNAKIFFFFAAGDYQAAIEMIDGRIAHNASQHDGSIHESFDLYIDGLAFFAQARRTTNAQIAKKLLTRARCCMRQLKALSRSNPAVSLGKYILLEAENAAIMKKYSVAEEKYNHAASLASKYGSYFELAFAKQTAGEHFAWDLGDSDHAIACFEEACKAYEVWEGRAAVSHLQRRINLMRAST